MIDVAIEYAKKKGGSIDQQVDDALDRLLVEFGKEILQIIPGKVSTEVDARYSFDTQASVNKALHLIEVSSRNAPEAFRASRGWQVESVTNAHTTALR